jgi:hypothetical protein
MTYEPLYLRFLGAKTVTEDLGDLPGYACVFYCALRNKIPSTGIYTFPKTHTNLCNAFAHVQLNPRE